MPCECVNTAIIRELEIEKLIKKVKLLEEKIQEYQEELYMVYSSSSNSSVNGSEINSPKSSFSISPNKSYTPVFHCMTPA